MEIHAVFLQMKGHRSQLAAELAAAQMIVELVAKEVWQKKYRALVLGDRQCPMPL